jgi:hypothetical protein
MPSSARQAYMQVEHPHMQTNKSEKATNSSKPKQQAAMIEPTAAQLCGGEDSESLELAVQPVKAA